MLKLTMQLVQTAADHSYSVLSMRVSMRVAMRFLRHRSYADTRGSELVRAHACVRYDSRKKQALKQLEQGCRVLFHHVSAQCCPYVRGRDKYVLI